MILIETNLELFVTKKIRNAKIKITKNLLSQITITTFSFLFDNDVLGDPPKKDVN